MTPLPQRRRKEGSLLPSFPAPQTIKVPKAVSDSFVVFEIYLKVIQRNLVAFVLMMPAFPLVFLIFARSLTPDGTEISSRLVTGSIVFGLGITTVNNLSQAILNDRFTFRLKLLVASPIHPLSYRPASWPSTPSTALPWPLRSCCSPLSSALAFNSASG